ncbi:MAG: pentapeptide repeat-containing protein [Candidatus Poseidoniaceae archaeon]|nr:pentapeptide repeat-containing protein [Candidatus Poseidoniaceae archaeon]
MSSKTKKLELQDSDFAPTQSLPKRIMHKVTETPAQLRLATLSAWRGKERGLAVIAGVFLASLVITTVLAYGVGLSQLFFEESLSGEPFDAKIEYARTPVENASGWSNNTSTMVGVCDELLEQFSEFNDCTLVLARQGIHSGGLFNQEFIVAQPLEMMAITDDSNPYWGNVTFDYPELAAGGPPISNMRSVRFLGPGAFDGEFADRLGENIIAGMGEWPTPENMSAQRGVILPSTIASQAKANVGDVLDSLTFAYVVDESTLLEATVTNENCAGEVTPEQNEMVYCRMAMTAENLTVVGIYEPWDLGNPTLGPNPIFTTWEVLEEPQRAALMDNDHMYLGVTIDRGQLPTTSTADAEEWLEDLGTRVQDGNYTAEGVELYYTDIVSGTITFLNIFLGLIQIFDYIIMIPIVILSISVLIYGLVLSLEQRRREVSIHRVIGADSKSLQNMVLLELFVMSSVAWLVGYLLALFSVPIVLSAVGFMEFRTGDFDVNPTLSVGSTIFTAVTTLGLALIFGRSRARDFISLEIEEGVRNTTTKSEPKRWLHWLSFLFGMLAVTDTWLEMNGSEDGIVSNFFIEGLLGIIGPFALWIGGALLLGRIGARGPQIMQLIFGRTPLLNDVKRGLKGSGSAESVNRLAVIMLLTLSIVTLAAVQGYTGTLVDEKTVDATVGSDLQITLEQGYSETELLNLVAEFTEGDTTAVATTVPSLFLADTNGGDKLLTWVVLDNNEDILRWSEQAIPGTDADAAMAAYRNGGFSAGEDAAYSLDLAGSGRGNENRLDDVLLKPSDESSQSITFVWEQLTFNFSAGGSNETDPTALFTAYSSLMEGDWSGLNLSGQNLSGRNFGPVDLTGTDLSDANLAGVNLSQALLFDTNLEGADLSGANLQEAVIVNFMGGSLAGANLIGADLTGAFGIAELSSATLGNATCPDGTSASETACASGLSQVPPALAAPLFLADTVVQILITPYDTEAYYLGIHEYIPGVSAAAMSSSLIIGESSWQTLVGPDAVANHTSMVWIVDVPGVSGDSLEALASTLSADFRVSSVLDWSSSHKAVERDGGLIFGTPGLLSLQFVVASIAAVASSFVFLSLVLSQRQKELAVLQAIGASPNQIIRLVLFEILSIVMVSMALGIVLGVGVALSFNGFFDVFGFIFQIFGGSSTTIERTLVYPWTQLLLVSLSVFAAVVVALLVTTRKALKSDLASVLKGE